jgi:hypothetical protein
MAMYDGPWCGCAFVRHGPVQMDGKGADLELVRRDRVTCAMRMLCAWEQRLVC